MGCSASTHPAEETGKLSKPSPEAGGPTKPLSACQLIDGRAQSDEILLKLKREVDSRPADLPLPRLVVLLVGEHPASLSYIAKKEQAAARSGIHAETRRMPATASHAEVMSAVHLLNEDPGVHGVIVQLPLPEQVNAPEVTEAVAHEKDVDGFTSASMGTVAISGREPLFCPCTPLGCLHLIRSVGTPLQGKEAVVIGASNIVGTPMALLLLREGCTVHVCHIDTRDTAAIARTADILVVAVGRAGLVKRDWVKPGAIVIDVGINFVPDPTKKSGRRMAGDVDDEVRLVASHLTPVPGGVGPMTVAMLMQAPLMPLPPSSILSHPAHPARSHQTPPPIRLNLLIPPVQNTVTAWRHSTAERARSAGGKPSLRLIARVALMATRVAHPEAHPAGYPLELDPDEGEGDEGENGE